jgi:ABC-type multidrug transport system fused ATPase/permease subunit
MPETTNATVPAGWMRHLLPLVRPFRLPLGAAVVAMVLDSLLTVLRPWPLKIVVDRVLSHHTSRVPFIGHWLNGLPYRPMETLYAACAATLVIALSTGALTYLYTRLLGDVGQRFVFALRRDLFAHLQRLSLRFHDRQRTGDLITRLTSDVQSIRDVVSGGSILLVTNGTLLVGMLGMMFWLNWQFALAALHPHRAGTGTGGAAEPALRDSERGKSERVSGGSALSGGRGSARGFLRRRRPRRGDVVRCDARAGG